MEMDVPTELVTGAIIAGTGLLLGNSGALIRLHQKLSGHIADEEENKQVLKDVKRRLRGVEKKLPNGEINLMYKMMKEMYIGSRGGLGRFESEVREVEKQCRQEQERFADELREEVFGDLDS